MEAGAADDAAAVMAALLLFGELLALLVMLMLLLLTKGTLTFLTEESVLVELEEEPLPPLPLNLAVAILLAGFDLQNIREDRPGSSRMKYLCSNVLSNPDTLRLTLRNPHRFNLRMKLRKMTLRKYLGRMTDENRATSCMANELPLGSQLMMLA